MSTVIPYVDEPRPDTGVTNGTIGIGLFLASEVMFVGALIASYVLLRASAESWDFRLAGQVGEVILATTLLAGASLALSAGLRRSASGHSLEISLLVSFVLASGFVIAKSLNLLSLLRSGLVPGGSTADGMFYLFSFFHAFHVLCAAAWIAGLLVLHKRKGVPFGPTKRRGRLLLAFWVFLDCVWVVILAFFYLS
jgi:cytochrome c oxidase subunit I+III